MLKILRNLLVGYVFWQFGGRLYCETNKGLVLLFLPADKMDGTINRFGKGPRELTGARDLISHFKLLPHHDFFCKNSRPVSVLDTHYLSNVVGDTEIRKGEGMQLDQLVQTTLSRENSACIKPFNLDVLGEAFHLQESASVNLSPAEMGIPTIAVKSKSASIAKDKHKKHKDKHKEKDKERKKHRKSKEEKEKKRDKHDKRKKREGDDDTSGVKKHKKT
ncbi:probable mediator of RNA polymerase II transcription subunit 19b isoform X2 [Salvia miltiorrhiza]|uniref:probable mediator of RNA polymerase II transcription subunit 19b isoform X2 n=1 Tax=Salvia miltiorrhiza TaxID=226208 RepID=UPI0025AC3A29|nr:probable mediator of RNA polymerase II transcription subunit 19b isoform X2 [Salvia miltiorrhiza]